jgi:hypothetical protein
MSIWDVAEDLATSAIDAVNKGASFITGLLRGLPGASWIEAAANQGAAWAHGLAATIVGQTILKTLAATLRSSVAWYVGPLIADTIWVLHRDIPTLFSEDTFTQGWTYRFATRTEEIANAIGTNDVSNLVTGPTAVAVSEIIARSKRQYPSDPIRDAAKHFDVGQLAKDLGIREDVMALAMELVTKIGSSKAYDPVTGKSEETLAKESHRLARSGRMERFIAAHKLTGSPPTFPDTAAGDLVWYQYNTLLHEDAPKTIAALGVLYRNRVEARKAKYAGRGESVSSAPGFTTMVRSRAIKGLGMAPTRTGFRAGQIRIGPALQVAGFDPLGFVEDVATSVVDKTKAAVATVRSSIQHLPGGDLVNDALDKGQEWAVDLAKNASTSWILGAISMVFFGPIAYALGGTAWFGPQIASFVWAFPGLIRGEDFKTAWLKEVVKRILELAATIGVDAAKEALKDLLKSLEPAINEFLGEVQKRFPDVNTDDALKVLLKILTPEELARKFGLRPDLAALILGYAKGVVPDLSQYDLASGSSFSSIRAAAIEARREVRTQAMNRFMKAHKLSSPPTFPDTAAGDLLQYQYSTLLHADSPATVAVLAVRYRNLVAARRAKEEQKGERISARPDMFTQVVRKTPPMRTAPQAPPAARPAMRTAAPTPPRPPISFTSSMSPDVAAAADPVLFSSKATLVQAIQELGGVTPTAQAVYWLLGLVYGESRFGTSPDWTMPNENNPNPPFQGASNNWGAVRYFKKDNLIVRHPDKGGVFDFQAYTTPLEGAKGFFRTIVRGKVGPVISDPASDPRALAEAMYVNGYYEGYYCSNEGKPSIRLGGKSPTGCSAKTDPKYVMATQAEADQRNISAYATMIYNESEKVRKAFSEGPGPAPAPAPPVPIAPSSTSKPFPYLIAAGVIGVGIATTFVLTRKHGGILKFVRS